MKTIIYIISFIFLASCSSNKGSYNEFIEYDYEIRSYYSSQTPKNLRYIEYYLNDTLIRRIGRDGDCTRYFYNSVGRLTETRWGRNCSYGRRNIMFYDSLGNNIGFYSTMDTIVDLDTVEIRQTHYYDNFNRLSREFIYDWNDTSGNQYEEWKSYKYEGQRVSSEITFVNLDTIWFGKYSYDSIGNLIEILRTRGDIWEKEVFKYDKNRFLIEKLISSNEYPLTKDVSFSAKNQKRVYQYDSSGFLINELIFSHKGKLEIKIIQNRIWKI